MIRRMVLFSLIVLSFSSFLFSQALEKTETIVIEFGRGNTQVGIDKGGGEHWKPLFFDIDDQGNIHIPDFYKARIAVYNKKGEFLKEKPCPKGISPRMNYFCLTPKDQYVTYGDYTLSLIAEHGKLVWEKMPGYGAIPRFVWANEVAIFLVLPGKDERAIVFDYFSNRPIGKFGFMDGDKGIPMIASENDGQFTFSLKNMVKIPESGYPEEAFYLKENAYLVYVNKKNNSLWKTRKGKKEYYYLFSDKGRLMNKGIISFPDTGVEGTGFWTVCDKDLEIYKNYFYDDYMEIVMYEFQGVSDPIRIKVQK